MNNKERIAIHKKTGEIFRIHGGVIVGAPTTQDGSWDDYEIRYLHHPMYGKKVEICVHGFAPPSWVKVILIDAGPDWIQYVLIDDEKSFCNGEAFRTNARHTAWRKIPGIKTITVSLEAIDKMREAGIDFAEVEG